MKLKRVIGLLALAVGLAMVSCKLGGEPKPTATPLPPLEGRLLLVGNGADNQLAVMEYKAGMETPQPLWSGIPGRVNGPGVNPAPVIVASLDHHYAMLASSFTSLTIVDLTDGTSIQLALPERSHTATVRLDLVGAFSPDSRYLAYALTGRSAGHPGMYLYDLQTHRQITLFEGQCASYGGRTIELVCAEVGRPAWLDEATLAFSVFEGPLPKTSMGSIGTNRTLVMDVSGQRLQELDLSDLQYAKGPTVLTKYGGWLEAADLKRGVLSSHPLDGELLLTPNGLAVVRWVRVASNTKGKVFDDTWHLTELRSGADQVLSDVSVCQDSLDFRIYGITEPAWAPDGKSFACLSGNALRVSSLEGLPVRTLLNEFFGYVIAWTE